MRSVSLRFFLALSVIGLLISCSKEGPQGDPGPAGPDGPQGPAGPGSTIYYSPWVLTGNRWSATNSQQYGAQFIFDRPEPLITQTIIDQGLVMAYIKGDPIYPTGSPVRTQTFQLPYSVGVGAYQDSTTGQFFDIIDQYDYVLNAPGNIRFLYKSSEPWDAASLGLISYRYVIVAGTMSTGKSGERLYSGHTAAALKALSYEELVALLKIPESGTNIR